MKMVEVMLMLVVGRVPVCWHTTMGRRPQILLVGHPGFPRLLPGLSSLLQWLHRGAAHNQ